MRWQGGRESDNVEDRRDDGGGSSGGGGPGGGGPGGGGLGGGLGFGLVRGGGISGILILVVMFFVLRAIGIDPWPILFGETLAPSVQTQQSSPRTTAQGGNTADDQAGHFARVVLGETEDVWGGIFKSMGRTYQPPVMVLFSGRASSACGLASAASGPFYCPGDRKLYLDLNFFNELSTRFGATGDFANAYVIAHEVGHHVQNLLGILPKVNQMRQSVGEAQSNQLSVRIELQADCFAGVWGYYTNQKGIVEAGDLESALNAAHQIGDDTLQKRSQGYVVPDSFTHGTAAQRATWFKRGFDTGKLESCDTFSGAI